jgi:probable selenium-dependent hydroxylase accessory protein YqeC
MRITVNGERTTVNSLSKALALRPHEHIALVGGGGKTTLMFALAEELRRSGKRVVASTTTKVWHKEALQYEKLLLVEDEEAWTQRKAEALNSQGIVFVGRRILDSGKVEGISPSLADEVFRDSHAQYLIAEADGSAGHPLKAPAEHEPVISSSVTMVVALMGMEAVDAPLDETIAFRMGEVRKITGLETGGILAPGTLARVFLHPDGLFKGAPEAARKAVFLNKGDLVEAGRSVEELADILLADAARKIDRVILGSVKEGIYRIITKVAS